MRGKRCTNKYSKSCAFFTFGERGQTHRKLIDVDPTRGSVYGEQKGKSEVPAKRTCAHAYISPLYPCARYTRVQEVVNPVRGNIVEMGTRTKYAIPAESGAENAAIDSGEKQFA